MKLLFDANLSPRLVSRLRELFPGSRHVFDTGLATYTTDASIWAYAREHQYIIVTADSDFIGLAMANGTPPKVVRLENCNYRTAQVEALLRRNAILIAELVRSEEGVLVIRNTPVS